MIARGTETTPLTESIDTNVAGMTINITLETTGTDLVTTATGQIDNGRIAWIHMVLRLIGTRTGMIVVGAIEKMNAVSSGVFFHH